jgi:hypothetical protein
MGSALWFSWEYDGENIRLVVSNVFYLSIIYGIILPIDELHHFARWFFNHQPAINQSTSPFLMVESP